MSAEKSILPAQCRAGRALLDLSRDEFAALSGVSRPAIADFETGKRQPLPRTLADVIRAFEVAGIEFTDMSDRAGAGVRFKSPLPNP